MVNETSPRQIPFRKTRREALTIIISPFFLQMFKCSNIHFTMYQTRDPSSATHIASHPPRLPRH